MFTCRKITTGLLIGLVLSHTQIASAQSQAQQHKAEPVFVVGGLIDEDGTWDLQFVVDWLASKQTSMFVGVGKTQTQRPRSDLSTTWFNLGLDHAFSDVGVTAEFEYWGDEDRLTTIDFKGSFYYENDKIYLAALGEVRDIDITFQTLIGEEVHVDTASSAVGGRIRVKPTKDFLLYATGKDYSYRNSDRTNLILLCFLRPDICSLNTSPLILARSFLNYSLSAGFDYQFSKVAFNLNFSKVESFLDEQEIDVVSSGLVIPLGRASDIELIAGLSSGEFDGDIFFGGLNIYFYK